MSTSSFDPISFLMKVSSKLLEQYSKRHGIAFTVQEEGKSSEEFADAFIKKLEKEPTKNQEAFWMDIDDIDSISTQNGCEYLLNRVQAENISFDEQEFEKLENLKERAMYFYLNHYDIFNETCDMYSLDMKQGWRGRKTEAIPFKDVRKNLTDLENALKEIYRKEYKGKNLKIKHVDKSDRIYFIAYIEDVFTNDLAFEGNKLNNKLPRRPVLRVYFLYRPTEGIIEVKAKGGKKRFKLLQDIFITSFLQADPDKHKKLVRYDFNKINNLDALTFPTEAKDNIESVTLKGIRIVHNENDVRLSIDVAHNPKKHGVLPMQDKLNEMNIDLEEFEVKQFKLLVVFNKVGQLRQQRVTTAITFPNICNLKERKIDNTIRKLLKKWKLDLL